MVLFPQNSILAIAGDDESVRLHVMGEKKMVCEFKAHETRWVCFSQILSTSSTIVVPGVWAVFWGYRVKAVDSFVMEDYCVMVTASNDGLIKMWKLHLKEVSLII